MRDLNESQDDSFCMAAFALPMGNGFHICERQVALLFRALVELLLYQSCVMAWGLGTHTH